MLILPEDDSYEGAESGGPPVLEADTLSMISKWHHSYAVLTVSVLAPNPVI